MLARAIFACNSLARFGGVAPWGVVIGRQRSMLPPLEADEEGEAFGVYDAGSGPSAFRGAHWRIQGIALQRMIEAISIARVSSSIRTRATESREGRFRVGDQAEIHWPLSTTD
eukprot:8565398-Pyramimonas_sp.AAC.1